MTASRVALGTSPLAAERGGLDACVHCGFCLQSCPTYLALDDENDSPRGRVLLMRGVLEGELAPDDEDVDRHISRCLGCRACETACPSGVPYGRLLEATRATLATVRPTPLLARIVLAVFEHPTASRIILGAARLIRRTRLSTLLARLPGRFGFACAMLEATRPVLRRGNPPGQVTPSRGRVALLEGCVTRGLFAHTNEATVRTLEHNGYTVLAVRHQRCCGALHLHAGDLAGAQRLARANIDAFEAVNLDAVAVNAAGCGAMMKEYGHLLRDDAQYAPRAAALSSRVRDASELLAAAGPARGTSGIVDEMAVYDPPCHLLHAQRVTEPPVTMLKAVPGLVLTPLSSAEQCCGAAGIYNLIEPETSAAVLATKLRNIESSGATLVATGNPGCLMQIGAGLIRAGSKIRAVHPVDLLDHSYRTAP